MRLRHWMVCGLLLLVSSCGWLLTISAQSPDPTSPITLLITGSELGAMKPCGCTGGQLGGLSRRAGLLSKAPIDRRLVLDTGHMVPSSSPQDLIKFQILMQAYALMGYDVLHVTQSDWETGQQAGALVQGTGVALLTAIEELALGAPIFHKSFSMGKSSITVQVKALSGRAWLAGEVDEGNFSNVSNTLTVVVVDTTKVAHPENLPWRNLDVDSVIIPLAGDEPQRLSKAGERPLAFSPGRFGRYLVRLTLDNDPQTGNLRLDYDQQAITEDLSKKTELVDLYKMYQQIVRAEDLLTKHIKVPLPGVLEYTGSAECRECHEYEYSMWSSKGHAHAFATLEKVGSDRDPECVVCHVVGLDYDTGFISIEETPELKDVGCEVCHGPGSEHCRSAGKLKMPEPKWDCLKCHTPDHSGGFAGHEQEYREKIRHWKEPKATNAVQ